VTNAIIHGYEGAVKKIVIECSIEERLLTVSVTDTGRGIPDVKKAMEPLFTTKAECDRAGMGFAFMEAFMDTLDVVSSPGQGTRVTMSKQIMREPNKYERL
jgi:stage II sporulation protein AB (anti-sigma F factor)